MEKNAFNQLREMKMPKKKKHKQMLKLEKRKKVTRNSREQQMKMIAIIPFSMDINMTPESVRI